MATRPEVLAMLVYEFSLFCLFDVFHMSVQYMYRLSLFVLSVMLTVCVHYHVC